jgi:predicted porin
MKKHLIAAAVAAAFAVPAMAQVTVYGRAEVSTELGRKVQVTSTSTIAGVTTVNGTTQLVDVLGNATAFGSWAGAATGTGVTSKPSFTVQDGNTIGEGSSRFGFRGEEDLGGGLKALFQMEAGVNLDDGSDNNGGGTLFARTAMVGLSGGFGRVTLGRQVNPAFSVQGAGQVFGTMNGYIDGAASVIPPAGGVRSSHSVMYSTPTFSGLSISFLAAAAEGKGTTNAAVNQTVNNDKPGMSLGVNYSAGPLYLGFGWDKRETVSSTANRLTGAAVSSATREVDQLVLSAAYDLGAARLLFSWTEQEIDGSARLAGTPADLRRVGATETAMTLGVTVPMGSATLFAEYGTSETDSVSNTTTTGGVTTNNLLGLSVSGKETAYSLGVRYALSKRTWTQAAYGHYKTTNRLTGAGVSISDELKNSGFALTLSHSF